MGEGPGYEAKCRCAMNIQETKGGMRLCNKGGVHTRHEDCYMYMYMHMYTYTIHVAALLNIIFYSMCALTCHSLKCTSSYVEPLEGGKVVLRVVWVYLWLNVVYGQHNFSTSIFVRFRQIWTIYCSYFYHKDTGLGQECKNFANTTTV